MSEFWRELVQQGGEEQPLRKPRAGPHGEAAKHALARREDAATEEIDILDTGFTLREVGPRVIRVWLLLQVVGLIYQFLLACEVSSHLSEFDAVISQSCSPEHLEHGVCRGPMWNLSSFQDVVVRSPLYSSSYSFTFTTFSNPPTFLVVVDPVSKVRSSQGGAEPAAAPERLADQAVDLTDVRWTLELARQNPPQAGAPMRRFHAGQDSISVEDLSLEAQGAMRERGRVEWKATLTSRAPGVAKMRYVIYVEDATDLHSSKVSLNPHCMFGQSWKAFNKQHQGHSHRVLSWCRFLLVVFLLVGGGMVYAIHAGVATQQVRAGTYRFHLVVAAKFLLQDLPQQACIVLYLYGWYEASGLRCQLCMFNAEHCGAEHPFHATNALAFACVLLSSVANQALVRPVSKGSFTEDDICLQYTIRIGGLCFSVLPFTTGMCWASRSYLPLPVVFHFIFGVPCAIGWLTVALLFCFPLVVCCDD